MCTWKEVRRHAAASALAGTLGAVSMLGPHVAFAQAGSMMDGGMSGSGWMGGYGGAWVPVLLVVIVGLVVWIARGKGK